MQVELRPDEDLVPPDYRLERITINDEGERRVEELTAYQDARYAARYRDLVDKVRAAERSRSPGPAHLNWIIALARFRPARTPIL